MNRKYTYTLIVSFLIGLSLASYAFLDYRRVAHYNPSERNLVISEERVQPNQIDTTQSWFFGMFNHSIKVVDDAKSLSSLKVSEAFVPLAYEGTLEVVVMTPDSSILRLVDPKELVFVASGLYRLEMRQSSLDAIYTYHVELNVNLEPKISLSKLQAEQGDVVMIRIDQLESFREVELKAPFKPSEPLRTDQSMYWFLPVVYRQEPGIYPIDVTIDGKVSTFAFEVLPYDYKAIYFTVDASVVRSTVGNPEAVNQYRSIIWPTYERFEEVDYWRDPFILPVDDARISSTFGEMRYVNNALSSTRHVGIDYALPCGSEVKASNRGRVEVSEFLIMIGNTIVIDHGLGLKTYYEHMDSLSVEPGDIVERGQVIGTVGTTGYSTGCHLHFQAMIKNQSFNPEFLYELRKNNP